MQRPADNKELDKILELKSIIDRLYRSNTASSFGSSQIYNDLYRAHKVVDALLKKQMYE